MLALTPAPDPTRAPAALRVLRRAARLCALVVAALLLGASATIAPAAAQAAQVSVALTPEGPNPPSVEVPAGSTVVFVNEDSTPHRVTAALEGGESQAWEYDSGEIGAGATSKPTPELSPGRYVFTDTRSDLLMPQEFGGEILVPAPAASPSPSPSGEPSGEPSPSGSPSSEPSGQPGPSESPAGAPAFDDGSPSPSAPAADGGSPAPSGGAAPGAAPGETPPPAGGTGATTPLSLDGGFTGTGTAPVPIPGDPLAPAIAPPLTGAGDGGAPAPLPYVAAPLEAAPSVSALPTGSLPGAVTARDRGLPAVLAALLVVGIVSMLVRVLLAEPAARRAGPPARGVRPVAVTG